MRTEAEAWEMVLANDGLLGWFGRRYPRLARSLGRDWRQVARLYLFRAALTWDPGRARFSTWATIHLLGLIEESRRLARQFPRGTFFVDSLDYYPDPAEGFVEAADRRDEAAAVVPPALARLPARERAVLLARFGDDPATLRALARRLGLTRERVRQIEARALAKARLIAAGATLFD